MRCHVDDDSESAVFVSVCKCASVPQATQPNPQLIIVKQLLSPETLHATRYHHYDMHELSNMRFNTFMLVRPSIQLLNRVFFPTIPLNQFSTTHTVLS